MTNTRICTLGMLTFKKSPVEQIPLLRQRAMLAESALHNMELILLKAENYNILREEIQGYVWSENEWISRIIRVPDVVIIIGSEHTEAQTEITNFIRKNRLTIEDIGMNKEKASQLFAGTHLKKYLIPWEPVPKQEPAKFFHCMLSRYPQGLVVKRTTANQGVGLLFTTKTLNGNYTVINGKKNYTGSTDEVSLYLEKSIAGRLKYRDYVAQQYIHSCTPDNRSFDIRVHVQKRRDGEWAVTRDYMRLAEYNNPLPNTSKGGYQGSLDLFLKSQYNDNEGTIRNKILDAALEIAIIQDSLTKKPISELGIDLLLDEAFNIWLIETNALPQTFHHEHLRAIYILEYILYLLRNHQNGVL